MSGIAGVWNLDARPIAPDVLSAMSGRMRHRGADGEGHRISGAVGFACQHLWTTPEELGERQPLVARSGAMLVLDGRIDNRDELIKALHLDASVSDAASVLSAYEAWGDRFAERLNGDFAVAIFDPLKQQLLLARDCIGIRPLYYYSKHSIVAFASEIKALLAHPDIPTRFDNEGVADFMLIGTRPLDRQDLTCFQDISAVVPAHVVVVTRDRVATRRYWDFDTGQQIRLRSFDDYVEAFRERFAESVRRRMRSHHPAAISVSGGLDSSSIFCQAETLRRSGATPCPSISGVSYVSDKVETDERQYLCEIERQYNVQVERFQIEPLLGLVRGAEEQIRAIEAPFLDYMWGVTRRLHERSAASGARTLLSGHWGDQVLFSSAYLIDLFRRLRWRSIGRHSREYRRYFGKAETRVLLRRFAVDLVRYHVPRRIARPLKWVRLRFFDRQRPKPWFAPAFLDSALRFRYRPAMFGSAFHSAHARAVYIEARSKYHVQCMEWNNKVGALHGLDVAFPFLDRDLLAFLMAIPGEVHAHDGVPRVLLREAMRGVLPDPVRARTWKSDFSGFVNSGLSDDAPVILQALSEKCLGVKYGFLDPERLVPALALLAEGLNAPNCEDSWELGDTYGLEVWLQVFSNGVASDQSRVAALTTGEL